MEKKAFLRNLLHVFNTSHFQPGRGRSDARVGLAQSITDWVASGSPLMRHVTKPDCFCFIVCDDMDPLLLLLLYSSVHENSD
jgi:hypothetical protein